jgi:hypothetical protein
MKINRTLALAMFISTAISPCAASAAPTVVSSGAFTSGAHATKGTATIYKLDDGTRVLRLTDFSTSNGPEVHVYLAAAKVVKRNEDVTSAGFVDLGDLKSNTGNQNYPLPASVALDSYHTISIWCARFHVNFGSAALK